MRFTPSQNMPGGHARVWSRLTKRPSAIAGMFILAVFGGMAVAALLGIIGQDWANTGPESWAAPGPDHWFGTNRIGQDIFNRTIFSAYTAFEVGVIVSLSATLLGAVLGGLSGWFSQRAADELILWVMGVLDSIPFYLFVAAVAYAMQGSAWAMHIGMIVTFWTGTARLVRGEVIRIREREFVTAARAIGLPTGKIILRHVLPNTAHILLVQATLVFVAAIKTEVILSFLGLGRKDSVSWGVMLAESTQEVLSGHFANFIAASGFLFVLLLALNVLGDALQEMFDLRGENA